MTPGALQSHSLKPKQTYRLRVSPAEKAAQSDIRGFLQASPLE